MGSICEEKILQGTETSPFRLCSLCSANLPPRGNFFGSFAPWDFFFFFFPPLGGQGKQEGSRGAPGVVSGGASSLPLGLGRARGVEVLLAFVWRERAHFLLSFAFGRWWWGSCPLSTDFPFPCLRVCGLSLILTARSTT